MCYFCNRKDTHCGVICAIIYLRVIWTREQPRNASAFLGVVAPFFASSHSPAVKRRNACRAPQSAEFCTRPQARASADEASGVAELRARISVLESWARPTITVGQTRERWSDAMASARRSGVVSASFAFLS